MIPRSPVPGVDPLDPCAAFDWVDEFARAVLDTRRAEIAYGAGSPEHRAALEVRGRLRTDLLVALSPELARMMGRAA